MTLEKPLASLLANGRCLRFTPDMEPTVLVRLIRMVEAA